MNNSLFDLTGTTALVTGCNKGIGKGMALGLAEAGADIIGVSATMPLQGSEVGNEMHSNSSVSANVSCFMRDVSFLFHGVGRESTVSKIFGYPTK